MTLLLDRFELGSVELLVEIRSSFIGETVETAMDSLKKPVPREFFCSTARVIGRRTAKCFNSAGCEVTFLTQQFKDSIVSRYHPLGGLSHFVHSCVNGAHILPDVKYFGSNPYQTKGNLVLMNSNPEQVISNTAYNN